MNYYELFYWITRGDSMREFSLDAAHFFTVFATLSLVGFVICMIGEGVSFNENHIRTEEEKKTDPLFKTWNRIKRGFMFPFIPLTLLAIIFHLFSVLIPTKKEALLILGGGGVLTYLTSDSTGKQFPKEIGEFTLVQLKSYSKQAQVELGIMTEQDKVLDQLKNLSGEQLINLMKIDTNISKLILTKK